MSVWYCWWGSLKALLTFTTETAEWSAGAPVPVSAAELKAVDGKALER